jgi:hypothetical protein
MQLKYKKVNRPSEVCHLCKFYVEEVSRCDDSNPLVTNKNGDKYCVEADIMNENRDPDEYYYFPKLSEILKKL